MTPEREARITQLLNQASGFYSAHADVMNLVCGLEAELKRALDDRKQLIALVGSCGAYEWTAGSDKYAKQGLKWHTDAIAVLKRIGEWT